MGRYVDRMGCWHAVQMWAGAAMNASAHARRAWVAQQISDQIQAERDAVQAALGKARKEVDRMQEDLARVSQKEAQLEERLFKRTKAAAWQGALSRKELSKSSTNEQQLRAQVALQSNALAIARGEKSAMEEALGSHENSSEHLKREEARLNALYEEAVTALEGEIEVGKELRSAILHTHWATCKLYAWASAKAMDGSLSSDAMGPVHGPGLGLTPQVTSSMELTQWDQRMLEKVLHWVKLKTVGRSSQLVMSRLRPAQSRRRPSSSHGSFGITDGRSLADPISMRHDRTVFDLERPDSSPGL